MLTIVYDPLKGEIVPDGLIRSEAEHVLKVFYFDCEAAQAIVDRRIVVGSCTIVDAYRLAVRQGHAYHQDLEFEFEGQRIKVSPEGRIAYWPPGFGDCQSMILRDLASPISPGQLENSWALKAIHDKLVNKDQQQGEAK